MTLIISRYCLPSGNNSSKCGFGKGSIAFHIINKRIIFNPRSFNLSKFCSTMFIYSCKSTLLISWIFKETIGRYGGNLLLEAKFTPLNNKYLP